jgi:hypothetical protein
VHSHTNYGVATLKEYLLPPGMTFVIDTIEAFTNGVTQVKMHEVAMRSDADEIIPGVHLAQSLVR